ncbi:MAG: hypothetical protein U0K86_01860 [Agathobacter sp.]|nr:hypothetical protein [Agathobacter sp.]
MGRAGAGGAGGHHSSGGGRSSGRVSGGSRMGSSGGTHHRAGSGSFGVGFGGGPSRPSRPSYRQPMGGPGMPPPPPPMRGPGMPPPPPPRRGYGYRRTYHGGNGMGCGGTIASMMALVILCIVLLFAFNGFGGTSYFGGSSVESTIERTKIETKNAYINDCVVDELGWFDSKSQTADRLRDFWEETGVQPYIMLRAYDPNLKTEEQKQKWAEDYYDSHFDTENIFLFVYFGEFDTDNDGGYRVYVNGYETSSVMDTQAVEIFFNYLDKYWVNENISTDDVFVKAFNDTGKTIMKVKTSKKDVIKWVLIVAVVGVGSLTVVNLVKQKNKRAKEKAEEERRILETPIHDMAEDNLEQKYLQK